MAYSTTTRSTLRTRIRERLLNTFWSDAELNSYVDEALRVWNAITGYHRQYGDIVISQPLPAYANTVFGARTMAVLRIEDGTSHLNQTTLESVNNLDQTWFKTIITGTTAPAESPYRRAPVRSDKRERPLPYAAPAAATPKTNTANYWFHVGLNNVVLYPNTSYLNGIAYIIERSPIPANDSAFIQVSEEDMSAIVDYATFIGKIKEGGSEVKDALIMLRNFLAQAAKYNAKLVTTSIYRKVLGVAQQSQSNPTVQAAR